MHSVNKICSFDLVEPTTITSFQCVLEWLCGLPRSVKSGLRMSETKSFDNETMFPTLFKQLRSFRGTIRKTIERVFI